MTSQEVKQTLLKMKGDISFIKFLSDSCVEVNIVYGILEEFLDYNWEKLKDVSSIPCEPNLPFNKIISVSEIKEDCDMRDQSIRLLTSNETEATVSLNESSNEKNKKKIYFELYKESRRINKFSFRAGYIKKKLKSMFQKHILSKLNNIIYKHNPKLSNGFKPFPKKSRNSISIIENKKWANKKIRDLMCSSDIMSGRDKYNLKINSKLIDQLKSTEITEILEKNLVVARISRFY